MSDRYRLVVNATPASTSPAARDGLLAAVLGALHERVIVEDAQARTLLLEPAVVEVVVTVLLAGEGEARDSIERIRHTPGLPPVDSLRYTLLRRDVR